MSGNHAPIGEDDLQALIDGRLTDARRAQVDAYLAEHSEIENRVAEDRGYRDALRAELAEKFAEPIPARLRIASLRAARSDAIIGRLRATAAAIAIFFIGVGIGWVAGRSAPGATRPVPAAGSEAAVARDATVAYRTFVVEVVHPVEVGAAHEGHLLKWLSKRLGRRLLAPDLSQFGYRLIGGRLLPADGGAAAQLMYQDASGKRLTVYIEAARGNETAFRFREEGKVSTFTWIDRGFGFAVTAPAGRAELLPIAEAVYRNLEGARKDKRVQKG